MSRSITTNIIRFIIIFLAQIWVFKQITYSLGEIAYIHFLVYPLAILLLPIRIPKLVILVIAFLFGLGIDTFYDSIGVHASALLFTAYFRGVVIAFLEPYEGYNITDVPSLSKMGFGWFVSYISILLFIHIFIYFCLDAFSFVYFFEIFLNTIFSFIVTFLVVIVSQFIFRTKY